MNENLIEIFARHLNLNARGLADRIECVVGYTHSKTGASLVLLTFQAIQGDRESTLGASIHPTFIDPASDRACVIAASPEPGVWFACLTSNVVAEKVAKGEGLAHSPALENDVLSAVSAASAA